MGMRRIVWMLVGVGVAAAVGCGTEAAERELLTRREAEPQGEHCKLGGTAVRTGLDRDGDGVLADAEVEHVEYVCDAATAVLVRRDPLAPSLECPAGGEAVQTGIDDDGDGALGDAEIDQTTRVCDSIELWDGDFTSNDWADPLKVAALRGARVVTGSLVVGVAPEALPLLELVTGNLTVSSSSPVRLPALRRVVGNAGITSGEAVVELPALTEISGGLYVGTGAAPVELPALAEVGGDLALRPGAGTAARGAISLGAALRVRGGLSVDGDGSLVDAPGLHAVDGSLQTSFGARGVLALPGLQTIGGELLVRGRLTGLRLDGLTAIAGRVYFELVSSGPPLGVLLPELRTIGGDLDAWLAPITSIDLPQLTQLSGDLSLSSMPLTRISLPRVTQIVGEISLHSLYELDTLELARLATVGRIVILDSPALTALPLPALEQVGTSGAATTDSSILIANTALAAVDWPFLRAAEGDVVLNDCSALASVQLPRLTTAAGLTLIDDPFLATVLAPSLTGTNPVDIAIYAPVHALELGALTTARNIQLNGTELTDLTGLRSLTSVSYLDLHELPQLRDLRGLASLTQVGTLELYGNPALTSLDGLERVTEVRGLITMQANAALASVAGLRNVTHVRLGLYLEGSPALTGLAFTKLASINGSLWIRYMSGLTSLSGLAALSSVAGEIEITGTTSLPQVEIQAFLTRLGR